MLHYEVWKYCQCTGKVHAKVVQNLMVCWYAGRTIPALGAWADYAAAFQKRRQELAAAKASGAAITLPHGPPTIRPHLPGPPFPRPISYSHLAASPTAAATPPGTHAGSISNTISDALTEAAGLDSAAALGSAMQPSRHARAQPGLAAQRLSSQTGHGSVVGPVGAEAAVPSTSGRARAAARDALAMNGASSSPLDADAHTPGHGPHLQAPQVQTPNSSGEDAAGTSNGGSKSEMYPGHSQAHLQSGTGAGSGSVANVGGAVKEIEVQTSPAATPGNGGRGLKQRTPSTMNGAAGRGRSGSGVGGPGASRPKSGVRGASIGRLLNQMRASGEL